MRRWSERRSRASTGKRIKSLIWDSICRQVSRKILRFCPSVPSKWAGSANPQCAVSGFPGHTVVVQFFQDLQSHRMNFIQRIAASAKTPESFPTPSVHRAFRHDAAGRITCAEKQHVEGAWIHDSVASSLTVNGIARALGRLNDNNAAASTNTPEASRQALNP